MTNGLLAFALVWFIILNIVTYALFTRSHRRVAFRQSALSGGLLSGCAIVGGAPAGLLAQNRLRNIPKNVIARPIMGLLAIVQCGFLISVVVDLLVIDIF